MNAQTPFPTPAEVAVAVDERLLCGGCDAERETRFAHCPNCEDVTESYAMADQFDDRDERRAVVWDFRS